MRKTLISIAILVLVSGTLFGYRYYENQKFQNLNAGVLTINDTAIVVEIANNPEKRILGLSGRESLPQNAGMLFAFAEPSFPEFWMKDMKFSIDIIWMDQKYTVVEITKNISPETFPNTFSPKEKSKYVVEVNTGFIDKYKINVGDKAAFEKH
ncbi:MAG: DUF192 domain-containing protein [bacterium]|nr:DUF192 domain-containing protein [bacterium]